MQKILISIGLLIILIGIAWPWLSKIPFGRLPGDIVINKPNFKLYFPITTMILVSLLLTIIIRLFRKWISWLGFLGLILKINAEANKEKR